MKKRMKGKQIKIKKIYYLKKDNIIDNNLIIFYQKKEI